MADKSFEMEVDGSILEFDGRVFEIFGDSEHGSVRFLAAHMAISEYERKGKITLTFSGGIGVQVAFPEEQAADARRAVETLVAAGATKR